MSATGFPASTMTKTTLAAINTVERQTDDLLKFEISAVHRPKIRKLIDAVSKVIYPRSALRQP